MIDKQNTREAQDAAPTSTRTRVYEADVALARLYARLITHPHPDGADLLVTDPCPHCGAPLRFQPGVLACTRCAARIEG